MQNKQLNEPPFPWMDVPDSDGWWGAYTNYMGEWLPVMLEKLNKFFPFRVAVSTCDEYEDAIVMPDGSLDIAGDDHAAYWFKIDMPPNPDEVRDGV